MKSSCTTTKCSEQSISACTVQKATKREKEKQWQHGKMYLVIKLHSTQPTNDTSNGSEN